MAFNACTEPCWKVLPKKKKKKKRKVNLTLFIDWKGTCERLWSENIIYPGPSCMGCPKCARLWSFHFKWSRLNQLEGFPTVSPSHDQCNFFSCQHIRCFRQFLSLSLFL